MPAPQEPPPLRPMLWLVAMAVFMQMLDTTIVNTALPSMAADLGESPLRMQTVIVSYALTVAMLIPASGWLADRLGTRRVFVAASVLFTLGSLACAVSQTLAQLVPLVHGLGYRRVLVGNTVLVGLAMASFALVRAETPWYVPGRGADVRLSTEAVDVRTDHWPRCQARIESTV